MGARVELCTLLIVLVLSLLLTFSVATESASYVNTGPAQSFAHLHQLAKRLSSVQLCGTRLVEMVKGVCRGHVFSGYVNRFRRSESKINSLTAQQRFKRTISAECCRRSCSVTALVKYCGGGRGIGLYQ